MDLIDGYLEYVAAVRRYSPRTVEVYRASLAMFRDMCGEPPESLTPTQVRNYEVGLLDARKMDARTVGLHLSVLSGFCRYLVKQGVISSNPVRLVKRPKTSKRLPVFFREESMEEYFARTEYYAGEEALAVQNGSEPAAAREFYMKRLSRLVVSVLYSTGIRRSELISLQCGSLDMARRVMRVRGKGDKMREIPLISSLCEEISLYLQSVDSMTGCVRTGGTPLLRTADGGPLYPVLVDRIVKSELGGIGTITGKKSPHVLRHTLATELLDSGTDLNSIKELLGHSSLAATQVYTHNTIEKLKTVYANAHPRAKTKSDNGDQD